VALHGWLKLSAPKAGSETRAFFAKKTKEGMESAKRTANDDAAYPQEQTGHLTKNAAELAGRAKAAAMAPIDTVNSAIDIGKQAYPDAVGKVTTADDV
jgi:gas vesicle protein